MATIIKIYKGKYLKVLIYSIDFFICNEENVEKRKQKALGVRERKKEHN